jgi:hypothetical protein
MLFKKHYYSKSAYIYRMNTQITLLEYGVYTIDSSSLQKFDNESSPKNYFYKTPTLYKITKQTHKIPLAPEVAFGIKFRLSAPSEIPKKLTIKLMHPEIENPETNFSFTQTVREISLEDGSVHFEFYIFEKTWEMIPGFWTYQVCDDTHVLLETEFEVFIQNIAVEEEEKFFYDI